MTAHAGGSEYGSVAAKVPPREVPPRRSWGGRTALVSAALLAGVCVGMLAASARLAGSSRAAVLAGLGEAGAQLDADAAQIANIGDEIDSDMRINGLLHGRQRAAAALQEQGHCACDCGQAGPALAARAARATMLEQVGEQTFLGPCSGCPCMRSNDVESIVRALGQKLVRIEAQEGVIAKLEPARLPVDIKVAVGQKGQPGTMGPKGFQVCACAACLFCVLSLQVSLSVRVVSGLRWLSFCSLPSDRTHAQGPDGRVGSQGPQGPPGTKGPRGKMGPTGPKGVKGVDGKTGPPGRDGPLGKQGIQGPPGTEGTPGDRGNRGASGSNGKNGPNGGRGPQGDRGDAAPAFGPRGPQGEPGPIGPKGNKGSSGGRGDKGFIGASGKDGADGRRGNMGPRGGYGRSCDGVRPGPGQLPKTIDACGVCGGDESECAKTGYSRTAHSVGDPHYLTYDGISYDYQNAGEFILSRHMNDVEFQAKQVVCPNWRVRCNIGAAVITKNWNIQFLSEFRMDKIKVNGQVWTNGKEYRHGIKKSLDRTTALLVDGRSFWVYFNDQKVGDGCVAFGRQNPWAPPLPNRLYMDLYFQAPARWSSGLSMTGLYANFDGNRGNDWESISPSTMWWVAGTPSSAFSNPTYLLDEKNRITKTKPKPWLKEAGTPTLAQIEVNNAAVRHAFRANGDPVLESAWSKADEEAAFQEVDPLTAKMRKRLFAKMASEGVIERMPGEKQPSTELAKAELDIMPYTGMRPDHLRIEQQMLFREEWKSFTPKQRTLILAGEVTSSNAANMERMCRECVKGTEECVTKEIVTKPKAIGIMYKDEAKQKACADACLPWLDPTKTNAVCKCKIDCALDVEPAQCTSNAVMNYVSARTSWLIPAKGSLDKRCKGLSAPATDYWKGTAEGAPPRMWDQDKAFNFAVSFWWRPVPDETYKETGIKSLLYKGPIYDKDKPETMPQVKPLHIQVDGSNKDAPFLLITVAGMQKAIDFDKCPTLKDNIFTFIAVTKKDTSISVWCGADEKDACKKITGTEPTTEQLPCSKKVKSFTLDATAEYVTNKNQAIYLVNPAANAAAVPQGTMGKFAYMASGAWDPSGKVPLWDAQIPQTVKARQPNCD